MQFYLCISCNKSFDITNSLEKHYLSCIYHNYKKVITHSNINNEYIKNIIKILFEIEKFNIIDKSFIKINDILNNKTFKDHDAKIKNIYKTIKNLKVDYISYNELMHIISICFSIAANELNLLILCHKQCKKNLNKAL